MKRRLFFSLLILFLFSPNQLRAETGFFRSCLKLLSGPTPIVGFPTVGDVVPNLEPKKLSLHTHRFNKNLFRYFLRDSPSFYDETETPDQVEDYLFEIPLMDGTKHQIRVIISPTHYQYRGIANKNYAAYLVSSLPYATIRATNVVELTPLKLFDPEGILFARGEASQHGEIFIRTESFETEIELLLHEHGHNVGYYLYGKHPYPWNWRFRMTKDKRDPQVHTKGPTEDFAQSFSIFFISSKNEVHSGESERMPDLAQSYRSRFNFFNSLFSKQR
jgi:hypothetical protein